MTPEGERLLTFLRDGCDARPEDRHDAVNAVERLLQVEQAAKEAEAEAVRLILNAEGAIVYAAVVLGPLADERESTCRLALKGLDAQILALGGVVTSGASALRRLVGGDAALAGQERPAGSGQE